MTPLSHARSLTLGMAFALALLPTLVAAQVFPGRPRGDSIGAVDGIYMVLRGEDQSPLSNRIRARIRDSEERTRLFYAANSGGQFDLHYDEIYDVVVPTNPDGTRQSGWFEAAEQYVRDNYQIEPESFYVNVFDVSRTEPDPDQGWSGIAVSPGNNVAVQADVDTDWGQLVIDHELGHHAGAPHSGAYRSVNDSNYTPYAWNDSTSQYEVYNSSAHGWDPTPFGVHHDEYGDPFDVMGNISDGHFTVHQKLTDLEWLTDAQVPDLKAEGEGTYRIYAHDELTPVFNDSREVWGVTETYSSEAYYGLTYDRTAERYNVNTGQFEPYNQTITLEYRSGEDGVHFYMGQVVLDLDPEGGTDRNNTERTLEVGQSISDLDFATSFFSAGEGVDFLSLSPPPPSAPSDVLPEWFDFTVLGLGSDSIGSYIELSITEEVDSPDSGLLGDFNNDGVVDAADYTVWRDAYRTSAVLPNDTTPGVVNVSDYNQWALNYGAVAGGASAAVPEPVGLVLAVIAGALALGRGRAA